MSEIEATFRHLVAEGVIIHGPHTVVHHDEKGFPVSRNPPFSTLLHGLSFFHMVFYPPFFPSLLVPFFLIIFCFCHVWVQNNHDFASPYN